MALIWKNTIGIHKKANILEGTDKANQITGSNAHDHISAGNGRDKVYGGNGNDTVYGGAGSDTLNGNSGNDIIYGHSGPLESNLANSSAGDIIRGGDGNDTLRGGNGNDALYGNAGHDKLNGMWGDNTLYGGSGNDIYTVLLTRDEGDREATTSFNTINDSSGQDTIYLDLVRFHSNRYGGMKFLAEDGDDEDSNIDALLMKDKFGENVLRIQNFFDNTSPSVDDSGVGTGFIEYFQFVDLQFTGEALLHSPYLVG